MSRYEWPAPDRQGRRDNALRRAEWRARLLGAVPAELIERAAALRATRAAAAPRLRMAPGPDLNLWLPVGPTSTVRGQAGSRPRIAGRVRDLRVSDDGTRAYAATANGGVWFTSDAGTTWHPLGGWATTSNATSMPHPANILVCGALHVTFGAAADGADDVVHVATGELRPARRATPGNSIGGIGILHLAVPVTDAVADPFMNPWRREANNLSGVGIYRIARDPASADRFVAATSIGLFMREGAFVEDADWQRVSIPPFVFEAQDDLWTTDVAWTPAAGSTPARLWVALVNPDAQAPAEESTGLYVSENGTAGDFEPITLPNVRRGGRLGIGIAPSDPSIMYVLGAGARLWRLDGRDVRAVTRIPKYLFGRTNDQAFYDLAVAVHPTNPDMVMLGGSTVYADSQWSASLFRCTVTCTSTGCRTDFRPANDNNLPRDATFIGSDVHADVHALCWIPGTGTPQVWVGCDGGVYRSLSNGDRYTFSARNNGLAVVEPGYVACHPTSDGLILAGTQDNGTIRRIGTSVWEVILLGDGGGTVIHPTKPHGFAAQYTNADWSSLHTFAPPVLRSSSLTKSEKKENNACEFYSGGASMPASGDNARLVIGTNRVWLSETWNPDARSARSMRWVTLPSGTDPRGGGRGNTQTDALTNYRDRITACRFLDENRILVLCIGRLFLFIRNPTDGKWRREDLANVSAGVIGANTDIPQPTAPFLPVRGQWSDIAVHDAARGNFGSCYVATTGHVEYQGDTVFEWDRMDTLWWFDGVDTWHPTGLRNDPDGAEAPAFAVVCDPEDSNIVYVGTSIGVFRGEVTFTAGVPSWDWGYFANGLPEASVQDLAFFNHGGVKLLRAALQARGIWEVDVSATPAPTRRTYVRAHPYDMRRITPAVLSDPVRGGTATYPWNRSPDLVVRRATGGPAPTRPRTLPWRNAARNRFDLWVLQTALRAAGYPLIVPNGQWTPGFAAALRSFRAANGMSNTAVVDRAAWDAIIAAGAPFTDMWHPDEPTEADLHEMIVERREPAGAGEFVTTAVAPHRVHVCVHHAHTRAIAAGDVSVILLRRPLADAEQADAGAGVALSDGWRNVVVDRTAGTNTQVLPDGWEQIGTVAHPNGAVDARTSRVVTFELAAADLSAGQRFLLLTVVSAQPDPVTVAGLQGATVRDLVLNSRHAAARSVRLE